MIKARYILLGLIVILLAGLLFWQQILPNSDCGSITWQTNGPTEEKCPCIGIITKEYTNSYDYLTNGAVWYYSCHGFKTGPVTRISYGGPFILVFGPVVPSNYPLSPEFLRDTQLFFNVTKEVQRGSNVSVLVILTNPKNDTRGFSLKVVPDRIQYRNRTVSSHTLQIMPITNSFALKGFERSAILVNFTVPEDALLGSYRINISAEDESRQINSSWWISIQVYANESDYYFTDEHAFLKLSSNETTECTSACVNMSITNGFYKKEYPPYACGAYCKKVEVTKGKQEIRKLIEFVHANAKNCSFFADQPYSLRIVCNNGSTEDLFRIYNNEFYYPPMKYTGCKDDNGPVVKRVWVENNSDNTYSLYADLRRHDGTRPQADIVDMRAYFSAILEPRAEFLERNNRKVNSRWNLGSCTSCILIGQYSEPKTLPNSTYYLLWTGPSGVMHDFGLSMGYKNSCSYYNVPGQFIPDYPLWHVYT